MNQLHEGDMAPNFTAQTTNGKQVRLSEFRGKNVVLYFYPKDDTPGCTIEAKEFTEFLDKFANSNSVVMGVSYDDKSCHQEFIKKHGLRVELLCDTKQEIAKAYDSAGDKYAQRNTYLIDTQGKIKKIFRGVKPEGHAQQVWNELKSAA